MSIVRDGLADRLISIDYVHCKRRTSWQTDQAYYPHRHSYRHTQYKIHQLLI